MASSTDNSILFRLCALKGEMCSLLPSAKNVTACTISTNNKNLLSGSLTLVDLHLVSTSSSEERILTKSVYMYVSHSYNIREKWRHLKSTIDSE